MKIFYDTQLNKSLSEFGIDVPLVRSRTEKVFQQAKQYFPVETVSLKKCSRELLQLGHTHRYLNALFCEDNKIAEEEIKLTYELAGPHSSPMRYRPQITSRPLRELSEQAQKHVCGTKMAINYCLETQEDAYFLGGGLHHAMPDFGRGFCLFNDIVVAIRSFSKTLAGPVLVVDVDAHKGDGTAVMAQGDDQIQCLSIHMQEGWPLVEGEIHESRIPSDVEIGIPQNSEHTYLRKLEQGLDQLYQMVVNQGGRPSLVLVVQGSDPYEKDELPSSSLLKLTLDQMRLRDQLVYGFFKQRQVPQAYVMAGGYGESSHRPYCEFFKFLSSLKG
jgi:acetoin utilization deacetylase AcuC-like enzyme